MISIAFGKSIEFSFEQNSKQPIDNSVLSPLNLIDVRFVHLENAYSLIISKLEGNISWAIFEHPENPYVLMAFREFEKLISIILVQFSYWCSSTSPISSGMFRDASFGQIDCEN